MRKSPTKHIVKTHNRKNGKTHVKSYLRGHGTKTTIHLSKPTLNKPKGYTVTLIYSDKTREKQEVIATSYTRAIDETFENKHDPRLPIEISVVDPSIGEIIHWAGEHAKKYGEIATKKAYQTTKTIAKAGATMAMDEAKRQYSDYRAKRLIDQAYSPNRSTRTLARVKLQKDFPEVWKTMDISRS